MKIITLKRITSTLECVCGTLIVDMEPIACTLERPWVDNLKNVSCVPAGLYRCESYSSPRFKDTYQVMDVPGRTYILFHAGNTTKNTNGCILLGNSFGKIGSRQAVFNSRKTMKKFTSLINKDFYLNILDI